jgi:putative transposase
MDNLTCKYCGSPNVIKFGTFNGVQRYWCKDCKRKFVADKLPKMKTDVNVISAALSCYFGGMPLDAIQRHLEQQFHHYYTEMGIYNWIMRFSQEAVDITKHFQPVVGNTWIADETVLSVGGKKVWFFDVIDAKTRYLLSSRLTETRTTKDAALVLNEAKRRAGKSPKWILTDKMGAYVNATDLVFGSNTKHIQSSPFTDVHSTNIIERFHGTLKDRTKVIRGFKNMDTARLLTQAWLVHYNFFKEHESLGNVPPAVKMGATPIKDWAEVVSQTKTIKPMKLMGTLPIVGIRMMPTLKRKHPKRRPKELKQKVYTQLTLATGTLPRGKGVYTDRTGQLLSRRYRKGWRRIY